MSRPLIFLFPGQSSRDPEMFERARAAAPEATAEALGTWERLAGRAFGGEPTSNLEIQLAVHLAISVYRRIAAEHGLAPLASAGLSLGEYSHLVQIGALNEAAALELITARGRAYDDGPAGMMVAVQPTDASELRPFIEQVRGEIGIGPGDLAISNYNGPRQVVVAGATGAVERLLEVVDEVLYPHTAVIERRIPMHTGRFAPVAEAFRPALERAPWCSPSAVWWSNVTGAPVEAPTARDFIDLLGRHVSEPVQWHRTVDALLAAHPDAVVVEVGPRRVLRDLIARWHRQTPVFSLDAMDGRAVPDVVEEIDRARG
jgi:[acyl-carrier-protein] S-malonyltransferase